MTTNQRRSQRMGEEDSIRRSLQKRLAVKDNLQRQTFAGGCRVVRRKALVITPVPVVISDYETTPGSEDLCHHLPERRQWSVKRSLFKRERRGSFDHNRNPNSTSGPQMGSRPNITVRPILKIRIAGGLRLPNRKE